MRRSHLRARSIVALLAAALLALPASGQARVPGERWSQYAAPEEAGFAAEKLADAHAFRVELDSAAFMAVFDGAVLVAWGDFERRFMCHSVRKSLLSALYGVHVDAGKIDLDATLAELGIDDEPPLTDTERTATVRHLLQARSGIYRPAAYEGPNPKPARGAHAPGERWVYNNWDFNALATVFEQETGTKVFEEFGRRFAGPLGMQDYRVRDGYYHVQPKTSRHAAYPFRMSARDLARFGLLFLRRGTWNGTRVLSESWIEESTAHHSDADTFPGDGYGYMWWREESQEPFASAGTFAAIGTGSQTIDVVPGLDFVFVHRVDTYRGDEVDRGAILALEKLVLDARTGAPKPEPALVPLGPAESFPIHAEGVPMPREPARYAGEFRLPSGATNRVELVDGRLVAHLAHSGHFALIPMGERRFLLEDALTPVSFELDQDGKARALYTEEDVNDEGYALLRAGRLDEALEMFRKNVEHFPESPNAHDSLGEAHERRGEHALASACYARALELGRELASPQVAAFEKNLARVDAERAQPPPASPQAPTGE